MRRNCPDGRPKALDKEALAADLRVFGSSCGTLLRSNSAGAAQISLVHEDLSLPLRVLRDMVTGDVESILVDSEERFTRPCRILPQPILPACPRLELELVPSGVGRSFDLHGIEDEIRKSLERNIRS